MSLSSMIQYLRGDKEESKRVFGDVNQNADGTVTINIDDFVKRSNRRVLAYVAGLLLAIGSVGVVSNYGRQASNDSFNATKASFANNERNACISDRRSLQFQQQGLMNVFLIRAVAALQPTPETEEVFAVAPLGTFSEEMAKAAQVSIQWATVTESLDPKVVNLPVSKGGCGPPILTVEDLNKADEDKSKGTTTTSILLPPTIPTTTSPIVVSDPENPVRVVTVSSAAGARSRTSPSNSASTPSTTSNNGSDGNDGNGSDS